MSGFIRQLRSFQNLVNYTICSGWCMQKFLVLFIYLSQSLASLTGWCIAFRFLNFCICLFWRTVRHAKCCARRVKCTAKHLAILRGVFTIDFAWTLKAPKAQITLASNKPLHRKLYPMSAPLFTHYTHEVECCQLTCISHYVFCINLQDILTHSKTDMDIVNEN